MKPSSCHACTQAALSCRRPLRVTIEAGQARQGHTPPDQFRSLSQPSKPTTYIHNMAFRLAPSAAGSSSTAANPTPAAVSHDRANVREDDSSSCASSADDDDDDNFEDWQDDSPKAPVYALFGGPDKTFASVQEASDFDRQHAKFDLDKEVERLGQSCIVVLPPTNRPCSFAPSLSRHPQRPGHKLPRYIC